MTETKDDKDLIILALRQRIAALVSQYEYEMAVIRTEYTKLEQGYSEFRKKATEPKPSMPSVDEILEEAKEPK